MMILCSYIKKQECTMSPPRVLSSLWVVGCLHRNTLMYILTWNRQDLPLPTGRMGSHLEIPG